MPSRRSSLPRRSRLMILQSKCLLRSRQEPQRSSWRKGGTPAPLGRYGLANPLLGAGRMAQTTTDHDTIRQWVEKHGGKPAVVRTTHGQKGVGIIRIEFPKAPR